jgi:hypothetical protein
MLNKAYIITFDKGGVFDTFDYKRFHDTLTTAKGVLSWWHYLENSYILIVEETKNAHGIAEYVRKIAPKKKLLIVEINLNDVNGWLTKEAWDWINIQRARLR